MPKKRQDKPLPDFRAGAGEGFWERGGLRGAVIAVLTLAAYTPALGGGFIWDDFEYVAENPLLFSLGGLGRIWFSTETPQYYPFVFTSFLLEEKIWGLSPFGYHLANVVLHSLNALLVWRLLDYLKIPGAWLAGAVFALHPVHVESVAWISERKNLLSALFYLLALRSYLAFDDRGERRLYLASIALFVCALLSTSVTASLPAIILILLWFRGRRIDGGVVLRLAPFFIVGAASGLFTAWIEVHRVGASGEGWEMNAVERVLLAGQVLWFYLGKLAWPQDLAFSYARWEVSAAQPLQYLGAGGAALAGWALWRWRDRWGRGPAAAALFYGVTLGPVLGFLNVYPMIFSWVADHFQYLASIGPIALASAAAAWVWREKAGEARWGLAAAAAALAALSVLTFRQGRIYASEETIWRDTIGKTPRSWLAHNNLGKILAARDLHEKALAHYRESMKYRPAKEIALNNIGNALVRLGRRREAIESYRRAASLNPRYPNPLNGLGRALVETGRIGEGIERLREALRLRPGFAMAHNNLGLAYARGEKFRDAARHYRSAVKFAPGLAEARFNLSLTLIRLKRYGAAIAELREGMRRNPGDGQSASLLAWLLATAPRDSLRDGREAYTIALENLSENGENPIALVSLAAAHAELGRFRLAAEAARRAYRMALGAKAEEFAGEVQAQLELYLRGKPFRLP